MPADICSALMRLLQVIGLLWTKEVHQASCNFLYAQAVEAACALELHLPVSERDIKLHELVMIASCIQRLGKSTHEFRVPPHCISCFQIVHAGGPDHLCDLCRSRILSLHVSG